MQENKKIVHEKRNEKAKQKTTLQLRKKLLGSCFYHLWASWMKVPQQIGQVPWLPAALPLDQVQGSLFITHTQHFRVMEFLSLSLKENWSYSCFLSLFWESMLPPAVRRLVFLFLLTRVWHVLFFSLWNVLTTQSVHCNGHIVWKQFMVSYFEIGSTHFLFSFCHLYNCIHFRNIFICFILIYFHFDFLFCSSYLSFVIVNNFFFCVIRFSFKKSFPRRKLANNKQVRSESTRFFRQINFFYILLKWS